MTLCVLEGNSPIASLFSSATLARRAVPLHLPIVLDACASLFLHWLTSTDTIVMSEPWLMSRGQLYQLPSASHTPITILVSSNDYSCVSNYWWPNYNCPVTDLIVRLSANVQNRSPVCPCIRVTSLLAKLAVGAILRGPGREGSPPPVRGTPPQAKLLLNVVGHLGWKWLYTLVLRLKLHIST